METIVSMSGADLSRANAIRHSAHLRVDVVAFREKFDRESLGFSHDLSGLAMFKDGALRDLAKCFDAYPRDYFVAEGARSADTEFFSVPHGRWKPSDALNRLQSAGLRILLKRPEDHDPAFHRLLDELFSEVVILRGGMEGEKLIRLESSVFITSAVSTTPFHFDPEIAFFSQIEGEKRYHVFTPGAVREADLEKFYLQDEVNIGQVDLHACDPALEHVYELGPGIGFHQPQNAPHWVETRASRSVSYSFVFETDVSRARGGARACNYYIRKFGLDPVTPGRRPAVDAVKARTMRAVIPVRKRVGWALRAMLAK
jgi:hypothetical protein